jgi:nucleoside-diphosphate-sugar epimerase
MADGLVLITGSSGLIGTAVVGQLAEAGIACVGIDLRAPEIKDRIDIRDTARLAALLKDVTGIIHLAAVSRVIHGQDNPGLCHAVNADATRDILDAALAAAGRPWLIYASSREVYGQQESLPVSEDAAFHPLNAYARSKVDAEGFVNKARDASLQTAIVRFSSVYGSVDDHRDRVVPAFVAAAVHGGILRVDGTECSTDFTHVDDVANGVARVVEVLASGERMLPPIHFVSGRRTNLLDLAHMTNEIGGAGGSIRTVAARTFDVHNFVGDPERARALLGWQATTSLHEGLSRLAREFRQCA